jgi:cytochrome c biogenesis protein ResB
MTRALRTLASTRLTLFGMAFLGVGAALNYDNPVDTPTWVLAAPMSLLAVNLLAAVITNPRINRRGGLLVFHLGLLAIVSLAAIGRMTMMVANVELTEGVAFLARDIINVREGPWHRGSLDRVGFVQGSYTIDYRAGMSRGPTRSEILVPDGRGGWDRKVVGDDTPLRAEGYRFYTTFNKGFAAVLTWIPDGGAPVTGTVHMPSYPLFEHRQANRWTPDGGEEIRFWLQLDTGIDPDSDWRLDPQNAEGALVVRAGDSRVELLPGESIRLDTGFLRYERLAGWMGYRIYYDPTLHWLFLAAMIAVFGLAAHFWRKFGAIQVYSAAQESARKKAATGLQGGESP